MSGSLCYIAELDSTAWHPAHRLVHDNLCIHHCMESTKGRRVSVRYRTAVPILSIAPPRRSTTTGCGKPGLPSNYPIMTLPIAYLRVSSWLHLLTQELLSRAWNRSVTVSDGFWPAHRIATGDFGFNLDCPDLFIWKGLGLLSRQGWSGPRWARYSTSQRLRFSLMSVCRMEELLSASTPDMTPATHLSQPHRSRIPIKYP